MKKLILLLLAAVLILTAAGCGAEKDDNAEAFISRASSYAKNVSESRGTVELAELTPFPWDDLYAFAPGVTRGRMEEITGAKNSRMYNPSTGDGCMCMVFMQGENVAAFVYGSMEALGFYFDFGSFGQAEYIRAEYSSKPVFSYDLAGESPYYTYNY